MIFIALGSSIGDAPSIFDSAERFLKKNGIKILKKSKILKNPPIGNVAKNEFSNAVWKIDFPFSSWEKLNYILLPQHRKKKLKSYKLLKILQRCEDIHDRAREKRWDDRTLDLDILMFHDLIISKKALTLPHPEIPNRDFVLLPWKEIVDEAFLIPKFGALKDLITALDVD